MTTGDSKISTTWSIARPLYDCSTSCINQLCDLTSAVDCIHSFTHTHTHSTHTHLFRQ